MFLIYTVSLLYKSIQNHIEGKQADKLAIYGSRAVFTTTVNMDEEQAKKMYRSKMKIKQKLSLRASIFVLGTTILDIT